MEATSTDGMPVAASSGRVGLVGCVKSKRPAPSPAADLYTSPLFRGRRAAVEATCDRWFILSAKHGVLAPDDVVGPYDETLKDASRRRRRAWSARVIAQLRDRLGDLGRYTFEIHAGADYVGHGLLDGLRRAGAEVETPMAGLSLGQQLQRYSGRSGPAPSSTGTRPRSPTPPPRPRPAGRGRGTSPAARQVLRGADGTVGRDGGHEGRAATRSTAAREYDGKYRRLYDELTRLSTRTWDASFAQIEEVLGFRLPASARRHPAWWSNTEGGHSHARAWLLAGWRTEGLHLTAERVRFVRG